MKLSRPVLARGTAVTVALAAMAGLVFSGCGSSDDDQWKDETISIGSIFSTTGDGIPFGPQQVKGAQLAVDEINDDEGVNGAQLSLTQRNDQSDPVRSAAEMKALIGKDQVMAVLGPTFSNSAAEADPVANRNRTPVLAVSNTGPGIVGDCDYPCDFIFRDSLGEATAIPANVDNLAGRMTAGDGIPNAAVVYPPDDPFGESSADTAIKALDAADVPNSRLPINQTLKTIRKSQGVNPSLVFITASSGETVGDYIKQIRKAGFKGLIGGGNAMNSPLVSTSVGQDGRGAQSAAAWYSGNASEENQEFIAAYRTRYGEAPDQFAAQAYTGVKLLAEAAEDADPGFDDLAADREALKSALEKVQEETPLGEFSFTPDHDVSQPIWIVAIDGQGGYNLVEKVNP
jgi:branched-chain amino acid transport system substrate-binding protein